MQQIYFIRRDRPRLANDGSGELTHYTGEYYSQYRKVIAGYRGIINSDTFLLRPDVLFSNSVKRDNIARLFTQRDVYGAIADMTDVFPDNPDGYDDSAIYELAIGSFALAHAAKIDERMADDAGLDARYKATGIQRVLYLYANNPNASTEEQERVRARHARVAGAARYIALAMAREMKQDTSIELSYDDLTCVLHEYTTIEERDQLIAEHIAPRVGHQIGRLAAMYPDQSPWVDEED